MGSKFSEVTKEINYISSCNLANLAKKAGVKKFIFASSCSMYGNNGKNAKTENDELNPLTEYAKSKCLVEDYLRKIVNSDFEVSCLRFSTACGMSQRLRLDLVLNDFVASAVILGKISILSDGTPWRPLIDVDDMAKAIDWAISRDSKCGGDFVSVNVGSNFMNYQVKDIAYAVKDILKEVSIVINDSAQKDNRSYKVDFSKFKDLAPNHYPSINLHTSIKNLQIGIENKLTMKNQINNSDLIRLNVLNKHIENGFLDKNLFRI
jgi:nucleoside-diphosphate-sugar epimerase